MERFTGLVSALTFSKDFLISRAASASRLVQKERELVKMKKVPVVDLSACGFCECCEEVCPEVFRRSEAGYIEVMDLDSYPEECVEEVIKNCPSDCISWEES